MSIIKQRTEFKTFLVERKLYEKDNRLSFTVPLFPVTHR